MRRLVILCMIVLLAGCCSTDYSSMNTANLDNLEGLTSQDLADSQPGVSKIRLDALKETALTLGAQGGLSYRSQQINEMLNDNSDLLLKIFNFNGLMLDHDVLPPVLEQSTASLKLSDPNSIRIADRTYKIIQQAKFVTTAPTWDQYILMQYKKPEIPDYTLLPRNREERKIWQKNIWIGWQQGIQQANNIYAANLARLKRDYEGMMLYRKLLAQNMVSQPQVSSFNMGITTNENNTELRINDKALQITATPKFDTSTNQWKPAMVQP